MGLCEVLAFLGGIGIVKGGRRCVDSAFYLYCPCTVWVIFTAADSFSPPVPFCWLTCIPVETILVQPQEIGTCKSA